MAFWGIEIKPGKPYTHIRDAGRGRLRVSQAALGNAGNAKSNGKTTLQCNVGNKSPILLCKLVQDVSENCHLELEFDEEEEVMFSVLGQRSIHLSGYFVGSGRGIGGDDSDSYGEDIANSASDDDSEYDTEDEEYESDFIDDEDIEMFAPSPQRKSGVVIEEIFEDEKPANGKAKGRRLKKKNQVSDSDDESADSQHQLVVERNRSAIFDSEDEDDFPISMSVSNKDVKNSAENAKLEHKTPNELRKRKINEIIDDSKTAKSASAQPESGTVNSEKAKKKKKIKDRKPVKIGPQSPAEETVADKNQILDEKDTCTSNGKDAQLGKEVGIEENDREVDVVGTVNGAENSGKSKKKKKERVKKGKTSEIGMLSAEKSDGEFEGEAEKALNGDSMDQDIPSNAEPDKSTIDDPVLDRSVSETSRKMKKNKKKKNKDENPQDRNNTSAEIVEEDAPEENQQIMEDNVDTTDKLAQDKCTDKLAQDKCTDVDADSAVIDAVKEQSAKKNKNKKGKNNENGSNTNEKSVDTIVAEGTDDLKDGAQPLKIQEFPNGLIIEELSMGKPDGKRASPGRKVFVNYTGKLQNGKIFDKSGKTPFSFRLGIGEVIKGWDIGVKGMRVGDKRRLTVPPSMGYGEKGVGPIPGNARLVFDVELVNVK